ncbi:MAG: DUF2470 domain-containing protein [Bacteroidota bacterium]
MKPEVIRQARNLVYTGQFGVLSTISVKLAGFPFGSVVPYCLDEQGRPVVLISTIAQHTRNLSQDNRCSLTITLGEDDVQEHARIGLIGRMQALPAEATATAERYYRYFPHTRGYHDTHDFSLYYLDPVAVRYIGGFGAIHWIEVEPFLHPNPFHGKGEVRIVDHMNEDHRDSLVHYLSHFKSRKVADPEAVRMAGINAQGFDVFVGKKKVWFEFEQPIANALQAREALVAMARTAR